MRIEKQLKEKLQQCLKSINVDVALDDIVIETPKDETLGDFSSNVALKYAKIIKDSPVNLANKIISVLSNDDFFDSVTVAGPGFINFNLNNKVFYDYIKEIISRDTDFGTLPSKNTKVNLEYVSANPTGTLHLGHARGAAVGDSLARLLKKAGYAITREYYINDAGNQIDNLAMSLYVRYLQHYGKQVDLPEDGYHGQEVIDIANDLASKYGNMYLEPSMKEKALTKFKTAGKAKMLVKIKKDLADIRVKFDVYTSEVAIRKKYSMPDLLTKLKPYTYIEEGATFLKTTDYLDDKDRVLVKSDGSYTYLLPDIAYHLDKLSRGFDKLIDVLGADHHGYIPRITSSLMMFGYPQSSLDVEIIQMVRIIKDGEEIKMSKRTGNSISMQELAEMAGVDAVRYFFICRSASTHLDFDLNLAQDQSSANPVYYAQYAHARLYTVLNRGKNIPLDISGKLLKEPQELSLLKLLVGFEKVVDDAANDKAPYKITTYIQKLANSIHYFYTKSRIILDDDSKLTAARLALAKAAQIVIKTSLGLIGVKAPLKMKQLPKEENQEEKI